MSQKESRHLARRALAVLGTGALALGAIAAGGSVAHAEDQEPAIAVLAPGNIDPSQSGTIYIHKHQHQTEMPIFEGDPSTESEMPTSGVKDVVFTVYPLLKNVEGGTEAIDLTDPAAWDQLEGLAPSAPCTAPVGYSLGDGTETAPTDSDGNTQVTFSPGIGVYVVCETSWPDTVVDHAVPYIVTIPFPHEDGWLYGVHTYPKNGLSEISKTITPQDDLGLGLGSVIQFPVSAVIPSLPQGGVLTNFDIVDTLDTKLTPSPASDGVGTGVLSVTVGGVDVNEDYYDVVAVGNEISVNFTAGEGGGLEWLAERPTQTVVVTFQGNITEVGTIDNEAALYVNGSELTSNLVKSNWGDVLVKKVNARIPGEALAGATFEVYPATAPYAADCSTATMLAGSDPISVDGETEFTTEAPSGQVVIPGLFVSDSVHPSINASQRCYVLKETQAPAGYVTPTGDLALFPVAVKTGVSTAVDVTVANTQERVPGLPLTGSTGTAAFMIGGLALLLAAGGAALVSARRRQNASKQ